MRCISRITDDTYAQFFGNGRNKFYVEFRCGRPCITGQDVCAKCFEKNVTCKLQESRKFNHGKVCEPIPGGSHIYGGAWYEDGVRKWGTPCVEIIEYAIQCQKEARGDFVVMELPKADVIDSKQEMPRRKATATDVNKSEEPKKRTRKPKVATVEIKDDVSVQTQETTEVKKKTRKPKVATVETEEAKLTTEAIPKKRTGAGKKKVDPSPYATLIDSTKQMVHKEVVLPTHIEAKLDEFDADGYEIEYVRLTPFEANGTTYFRDSTKNKLYKKVKDKIGEYVGRWNPDNEKIYSDVPDSDAE